MIHLPHFKAPFWQKASLAQLTHQQWEALCDRCGQCCLLKVKDPVSHKILTTKIGCRLLDVHTGQCTQYKTRFCYVDDCIKLTKANVAQLTWLPKSCAYRLFYEGKPLPSWHPLCTNDPWSTLKSNHSVCRFVVHPALVNKPLDYYILD